VEEKAMNEQIARMLDAAAAARKWGRAQDFIDSRLITIEHLERHLPKELPFHGRVLKREIVPIPIRAVHMHIVRYICDGFFNCSEQPSAESIVTMWPYRSGNREQILRGLDQLFGAMVIEVAPIEQLPDILRERLRTMYWEFENRVKHELAEGCAIRPAPDRAA
jgi:hypothetical protein